MKATNWEFRHRALLIGLIFSFTFPLYSFDHLNAAVAFAGWISPALRMNAGLVTRFLFALAAALLRPATARSRGKHAPSI